MQWYLRKHEDVEVVREVEHWFVLTIETPRELRSTAFTVWFSDQDEPGKRLDPKRMLILSFSFHSLWIWKRWEREERLTQSRCPETV